MNLLGQEVNHKQYGKGTITEFIDNKITVCFAKSQKLFLFPDAFSQYLILRNDSIQKKVEKINAERMLKIEARERYIEREKQYRYQMYTMKIPRKSQVVYNVFEDVNEELNYIVTGCYLSGEMKGKPRIPANIQPNSAILLTSCEEGGEADRYIIGIAMVEEYFWGKECRDGHIYLHNKYKLILSEENRISFWKYFNQEEFYTRWGSVPYRYFENQTMQKILFDIYKQAIDTEHEEEITELYDYFCAVNRIPNNR